jgi:hypothetical protein
LPSDTRRYVKAMFLLHPFDDCPTDKFVLLEGKAGQPWRGERLGCLPEFGT